jgi:hypothetical protein
MGIKNFFKKWSKTSDEQVLEIAEEEARMNDLERELDHQDYQAKKDDIYLNSRYSGSEVNRTARDDLESF